MDLKNNGKHMTEARKIVIKEFEIPNTAFSGRKNVSRAIRYDAGEWHIASGACIDKVN